MMLEIHDLVKRFGANTAVDLATFALDRPHMLGIIGRLGAGKSTLLRMVNRLTNASSGRIVFEGRDVLALRGRAMRCWQSECAMIFQDFNLVPGLDVVTNVLLGRLNHHSAVSAMLRLFSREERLQAIAALDRLGIAEHDQRAERLSGGQQQRVAIARALMQDPRSFWRTSRSHRLTR